jgi:hypothetical protein
MDPYRIFICHAYAHRRIFTELVGKLNDAPRFKWRDRSVPYERRMELTDDKLRQRIGEEIAGCDVMLALTKPIARRREWLQWEINLARALGKPIVGVVHRRNDYVS